MTPPRRWSQSRPVPTEHEIVVCSSKVRYLAKQKAKDAASRSTRRAGHKIHVYECPACGSWHLTSTPQELVRAARRGA
jgi:hypothetical protein